MHVVLYEAKKNTTYHATDMTWQHGGKHVNQVEKRPGNKSDSS